LQLSVSTSLSALESYEICCVSTSWVQGPNLSLSAKRCFFTNITDEIVPDPGLRSQIHSGSTPEHFIQTPAMATTSSLPALPVLHVSGLRTLSNYLRLHRSLDSCSTDLLCWHFLTQNCNIYRCTCCEQAYCFCRRLSVFVSVYTKSQKLLVKK